MANSPTAAMNPAFAMRLIVASSSALGLTTQRGSDQRADGGSNERSRPSSHAVWGALGRPRSVWSPCGHPRGASSRILEDEKYAGRRNRGNIQHGDSVGPRLLETACNIGMRRIGCAAMTISAEARAGIPDGHRVTRHTPVGTSLCP